MALQIFRAIGSYTKKSITSMDIFYDKITFTYGGKSKIKSLVGGSYTIAIILLIFVYGYSLFMSMINRNRSNVTLSTKVIDLNLDKTKHYPGLNDFYFAFALTDDYGNIYPFNSSIFEVTLLQTVIIRNGSNVSVNSTPIPYEQCTENEFKVSSEEMAQVVYNTNVYCPTTKDYHFQGNYGAVEVAYVQIGLRKCSGAACAPEAFIEAYLSNMRFNVLFANSYVAFNDYDEPVKSFVDDRYTYSLIPGFRKTTRAYVRQNTADFRDAILDIGDTQERLFYSVERMENDFTVERQGGVLLDFLIGLDSYASEYERTVFTFFDFTGQLGGLFEILQIIGGICVGFLSSKILLMQLIDRLYHVESFNESENESLIRSKSTKIAPTNNGLGASFDKSPSRFERLKVDVMFEEEKSPQALTPGLDKTLSNSPSPLEDPKHSIVGLKEVPDDDCCQDLRNEEAEATVVNNFKRSVKSRRRYNFSLKRLCALALPCCKKNRKIYKAGSKKFEQELDCVEIINSIRQLKLIADTMMTDNQKAISAFNSSKIIDLSTIKKVEKEPHERLLDSIPLLGRPANNKLIDNFISKLKYDGLSHNDLKFLQHCLGKGDEASLIKMNLVTSSQVENGKTPDPPTIDNSLFAHSKTMANKDLE